MGNSNVMLDYDFINIENIYKTEYKIVFGQDQKVESKENASFKGKITIFFDKDDCRVVFYKLNAYSATIAQEQTKSHIAGQKDGYGNVVTKHGLVAKLKEQLFNKINSILSYKDNKKLKMIPSNNQRKTIFHNFNDEELKIFNNFLNETLIKKTTLNNLIGLLCGSNPSGTLKTKKQNYYFYTKENEPKEDITILISLVNKGQNKFRKLNSYFDKVSQTINRANKDNKIKEIDYINYLKEKHSNVNNEKDFSLDQIQKDTLFSLYELLTAYNDTRIDQKNIEKYYSDFQNGKLETSKSMPKDLINAIQNRGEVSKTQFSNIVIKFYQSRVSTRIKKATKLTKETEKINDYIENRVKSVRSVVPNLKNKFVHAISTEGKNMSSSIQMAHIYNVSDIKRDIREYIYKNKIKINNLKLNDSKHNEEINALVCQVADVYNIFPMDSHIHKYFDDNLFSFLYTENNWVIKYDCSIKTTIQNLLKNESVVSYIKELLNRSNNKISTKHYVLKRWNLLELNHKGFHDSITL